MTGAVQLATYAYVKAFSVDVYAPWQQFGH